MRSVPRPTRESTPTGDAAVAFRLPIVGLLGLLVLVVCVTPLAFAVPGLLVLYLIPVAVAAWLLRTRTVVDHDAVRVHRTLRTRVLRWDEVRGLRVDPRRWVRAVLDDDAEVSLPAVRVRDLPRLSVASGGRIPDPGTGPDTTPAPARPAGADPPERGSGQ